MFEAGRLRRPWSAKASTPATTWARAIKARGIKFPKLCKSLELAVSWDGGKPGLPDRRPQLRPKLASLRGGAGDSPARCTGACCRLRLKGFKARLLGCPLRRVGAGTGCAPARLRIRPMRVARWLLRGPNQVVFDISVCCFGNRLRPNQ